MPRFMVCDVNETLLDVGALEPRPEMGRARLETPAGAVDIALDVSAAAETGTGGRTAPLETLAGVITEMEARWR